jgi:hypothetical protein
MSESIKQRWRFELGRDPRDCKIFLNDEQWVNIKWFRIEAGGDRVTSLTFEVYPHEVQVDVMPSLEEDIKDGLFGER